MIKTFFKLTLVVLVTMLFACGGGETSNDDTDSTEVTETEATVEEVAEVTVSAEMSDFINGFDGTSKTVAAGLKKYGSNDEVISHVMGWTNLKDPKIDSQDGECYTLLCEAGSFTNTYIICWEDAKIKTIVEKF